MPLHVEDRETLKKSVARAIALGNRSHRAKRKFKKQVTKSLGRSSNYHGNALRMVVDSTHDLIDELWAEVINEAQA